jgi:alpha-1,3-rhamnosyl/mannosyltransferase
VHHGGGTAPLIGGRPIVLTVHDLQYREHPQYFSRARLAYLRASVPRSVGRAAVIATPSEFTRRAVVEAFTVPAERVVVVPHGVPEPPCLDADTVSAVRDRFGIGARPFVVYPAITHPHKRHLVLLDMLRELDPATALVLTGGEGAAEQDVMSAIAESGLGARVVRTGRVTDTERDALIVAAEALVFPSEYEGFGAPLVEAMALGTPIVCSDQPAITEVVGDAAVIVAAAGDELGTAWATAVAEAVARRAELVDAGLRRREAYTLEASGRALAGAYRQAAGS